MLKRFLIMAMIAVCVVVLTMPQLSAQRADEMVDRDGFSFTVRDGGYLARWIEQVYQVGTANLVKTNPDFAVCDQVLREIWKECNVNKLGRIAISGKEVAPDFFTVKQFGEIRSLDRTGSLWKLMPDAPLAALDCMPLHTLVAFGVNLDGAALMQMIDFYVAKYGNQKVRQKYTEGLAEAMQEGIDIRKLVSSISGIAVYVEADPARQVMPGFSSASVIITVKDRAIMDLVVNAAKEKNPSLVTVNNELLVPMEFGEVAVFQSGNNIIVTTDPVGIRNVIAGNAPSLKKNPDFVKYAAGTPAVGSGFFFCSSELGKSVLPLYMSMIPQEVQAMVDVKAMCDVLGVGPAVYSVSCTQPNGVWSICNTGSKGLTIFMTDQAMGSAVFSILTAACGNIKQELDFGEDDGEDDLTPVE